MCQSTVPLLIVPMLVWCSITTILHVTCLLKVLNE
uniref:Uncharacterized protein n=1 Tax=Rhizophora mucronata TaxID=61149 RepID=A0A2P2J385_RHIMU